jgi:hypothetical protein
VIPRRACVGEVVSKGARVRGRGVVPSECACERQRRAVRCVCGVSERRVCARALCAAVRVSGVCALALCAAMPFCVSTMGCHLVDGALLEKRGCKG